MPFSKPIIDLLLYRGHTGEVRYDEKNKIYYVKDVSAHTLLCACATKQENIKSEFQDRVDSYFQIVEMHGKEAYQDDPKICNCCDNPRDTKDEITFCKCCGVISAKPSAVMQKITYA